MGQVPGSAQSSFLKYGLVGNGRVAKHIQRYFDLVGIPLTTWNRKESKHSASQTLRDCEIILLAISDVAIEDFVKKFGANSPQKFVHFSGSLTTPLAQGFHPLMTFGESLYDLETYREISFISEEGHHFAETFPQLSNRHYEIPVSLKSFYHALCVLSGNFTVILWEKFFREMERTLKIPRTAAFPFLKATSENLRNLEKKSVLTGPLQRGDTQTVEKNLTALAEDPFLAVYEAFVSVFARSKNQFPGRDHDKHPRL